ncbi:MAG TPA: hypothetical protein VLT61_17565 [Anaeromyxobacteraceae bacterium]|nr:hypothetical protein [Anaeromyxobacteraceae bacterium]
MATDAEKLAAATKAVRYVLNRAQVDADLGYQIGPGMEAFRLLCEAEATIDGKALETVEAERGKSLSRWPRRYLTRAEHDAARETGE